MATIKLRNNGDVYGPASATDEAIAIYNGTSGKAVKGGPEISTDTAMGGEPTDIPGPSNALLPTQYAVSTWARAKFSWATNLERPTRDFVMDVVRRNMTTPANLKALYLFNATGDETTMNDQSQNSHTLSVGPAGEVASHFSPTVVGALPTLTAADAYTFEAADHDDWSLTGPTACTCFMLVKPTDLANCYLWSKRDITTGTVRSEWYFGGNGSKQLFVRVNDSDPTKYIGTRTAGARTSDEGTWQLYSWTYNAGTADTSLVIYANGVSIGGTTYGSGVFTGPGNTTMVPATYTLSTAGAPQNYAKAQFAMLGWIKGEALTADQEMGMYQGLKGLLETM